METDTWWGLVEEARAAVGDRADDRDRPDDPLPASLADVLAALGPAGIAAFRAKGIEVGDSAFRYPLWNAAHLIEGGCGDDGFMDFRDGLILLGRETFTRAVADPDALADAPVVSRMGRDGSGWIGYQSLGRLAEVAYGRLKGETDSLNEAVGRALHGLPRPDRPTGTNWNPEDEAETRRRLPRLAALFLG